MFMFCLTVVGQYEWSMAINPNIPTFNMKQIHSLVVSWTFFDKINMKNIKY